MGDGRNGREIAGESPPLFVAHRRGRPHLIRDGRRTYRVREILDVWIYQSRWWANEERRVYFRLQTHRNVIEIYRSGDDWRLAKVLD